MPKRSTTDEDFFNALQATPADLTQPASASAAPQAASILESPDPVCDPGPSEPDRSGWTLPLLCAGIGIIACCLLIPAADDNRRLVYEREKLNADLSQLKHQIEVNQEFLDRIVSDPALAERLAQRQMRMVREGTAVLELKDDVGLTAMSPYEIVNVPPPPPMPAYRPVAGRFADWCRQPRSQLALLGIGLMLAAAGLVLGSAGRPGEQADG